MYLVYDFGPIVLTFIGAILALFSKERKWTKLSGLVLACLGLILGLTFKINDRSSTAKRHSAAIFSLLSEVYLQSNNLNLISTTQWPEIRTVEIGNSLLLSTEQLEMKLNHYAKDLPINLLLKTEEAIEARNKVAIALTDKSKLDRSFPLLAEHAYYANYVLGKMLCQECSNDFTRSTMCREFFERFPDPPPLPTIMISITNHTGQTIQILRKGIYKVFEKYNLDLYSLNAYGSLLLSNDTNEKLDSIIIKDGNQFKTTGIISSSYGIAELFKKGKNKIEFTLFDINDVTVSKIIRFNQNSFKAVIDIELTKHDTENAKKLNEFLEKIHKQ